MATYTQLTRNADGEYIRETKKSPETFYLVEYATHATYYKVDAPSYEEACDQIGDGQHEGQTTIDRSDVFIDYTDKDIYDMVKQKNDVVRVRSEDLRELNNSHINLPNSHNNYGVKLG